MMITMIVSYLVYEYSVLLLLRLLAVDAFLA